MWLKTLLSQNDPDKSPPGITLAFYSCRLFDESKNGCNLRGLPGTGLTVYLNTQYKRSTEKLRDATKRLNVCETSPKPSKQDCSGETSIQKQKG